jgi:acyl-CoA synthetase (AMP-forming)/AMP-acid ligase II
MDRMRIEERLRESAARQGAQPAIVAGRVGHSYAELDAKSDRLAAALQAGGVTRGARVMVFMDNGWEAVVSLFAVLKAGGVVVPVGTGASAGALSEKLHKGQPVAIVTQSRLAAMVATAIASVWSVKLIVLAGGDRARTGGTCISFEETVGRMGRVTPVAAAGAGDDPAVMFGDEAPLTHEQLAEGAAATGFPDDGIVLPPLTERAGLSRLLAALAAGRTMVAHSLFAQEDERRIVERRSADGAFGMSKPLDAAVAGAAPAFQR